MQDMLFLENQKGTFAKAPKFNMTATLARTLYNCTLHHTLLHEAHFLNWPLTLSK